MPHSGRSGEMKGGWDYCNRVEKKYKRKQSKLKGKK